MNSKFEYGQYWNRHVYNYAHTKGWKYDWTDPQKAS